VKRLFAAADRPICWEPDVRINHHAQPVQRGNRAMATGVHQCGGASLALHAAQVALELDIGTNGSRTHGPLIANIRPGRSESPNEDFYWQGVPRRGDQLDQLIRSRHLYWKSLWIEGSRARLHNDDGDPALSNPVL